MPFAHRLSFRTGEQRYYYFLPLQVINEKKTIIFLLNSYNPYLDWALQLIISLIVLGCYNYLLGCAYKNSLNNCLWLPTSWWFAMEITKKNRHNLKNDSYLLGHVGRFSSNYLPRMQLQGEAGCCLAGESWLLKQKRV